MSTLGQKQTCAAQKVMSALPPKADMCSATRDVRLCQKRTLARLFDDLVGASDECVRDVDAQRLGSLEVDGQLDLGYLLNR